MIFLLGNVGSPLCERLQIDLEDHVPQQRPDLLKRALFGELFGPQIEDRVQ
jgi:hypothetical protein